MRTIRRSGVFKRDYKREKKWRYREALDQDLLEVVALLAAEKALPERNYDHALTGDWKDHRDCHIKPDDEWLDLIRLGSHSELGI